MVEKCSTNAGPISKALTHFTSLMSRPMRAPSFAVRAVRKTTWADRQGDGRPDSSAMLGDGMEINHLVAW